MLWTPLPLCAPTFVWAEAARRRAQSRSPKFLRPLEAGSDFAYFEEIELEGGKYKKSMFQKDGSKQKIEVDPLTGAPAPAAAR